MNVQFTPAQNANFTFQCTLDGALYTIIVTFNFFSQRYYINIYDSSNNLILCRALTGSPLDTDIDLVNGYFQTSTLVYRGPTRQFEINP